MDDERILNHAHACVADFQRAHFGDEQFALKLLRSKVTETADHHVFLLETAQRKLVLKFTTTPQYGAALADEYENLNKAMLGMASSSENGVATPISHSADLLYFVCDFVTGATLSNYLTRPHLQTTRQDVFTRLGDWLNVLHNASPPVVEKFWPKFYVHPLAELIEKRNQEPFWQDKRPMNYYRALRRDLKNVRGQDVHIALSHGDLHAGNIILDDGSVWGIDFACAGHMLNVIDVTRLLVSGDILTPSDNITLSALGITQTHQDAFFEAYNGGVISDVMAFSIRAHLLTQWLLIAEADLSKTKQRERFALFETRVRAAFGR